MIPLLGYGLTLFPWPSLPTEFGTGIATIFGYLYAFDTVLPIHEAVTIFFIMAGIEISILVFNFGSGTVDTLTGRRTPKIMGK